MKYEKNTTNSFLICSVLSVFPYPIITWKVDNNTFISENNGKEVGSLGTFHINSRVNITGSNSSYQCAIENPLLKQTWTGRWTMKGRLSVWTCCRRMGGNGDWFTDKERNTKRMEMHLQQSEVQTRVPGLILMALLPQAIIFISEYWFLVGKMEVILTLQGVYELKENTCEMKSSKYICVY